MRDTLGQAAVGNQAPTFTLPNEAFQNITLPVEGKKTVLAFFPAAYSGGPEAGCECQMKTLDKELQDMRDAGAIVFGISRELPFTMKSWKEKLSLGFSLLSDSNLQVAEKYVGTIDLGTMIDARMKTQGLAGYRSSNRGVVVIDERGRVIYKFVSTDKEGKPNPGGLPDLAPVKNVVLGPTVSKL